MPVPCKQSRLWKETNENTHTHTHIYTKQSHLKFTITNFKQPGSSAWQSYNFCLGYSFSHTSLQVHFMFLSPQDINTSPSSLQDAALPLSQWNRKQSPSLPASVSICLIFPPVIFWAWTDCSCLKSMPPLGYQIPNPSALSFLILTSYDHCFPLYWSISIDTVLTHSYFSHF